MTKYGLTNAMIRDAYERHGSIRKAAMALGIGDPTVWRALKGIRRDQPGKPGPRSKTGMYLKGELCTCCGKNKKRKLERGRGRAKYLCQDCWENADVGTIFPNMAELGF